MTVSQLMREMSALEETYWQAYYQEVGPFGDHRADLRNAQLLQLIYSVNAGKKGERKKLTDWLPFYRKKAEEDPDVSTKLRDRFSQIIQHQGK